MSGFVKHAMLRLTKKVDYGILAMAQLAATPGTVVSARELSERYGLSTRLMANVLKALARAAIVESVRGLHGGYTLESDPRAVTLGKLVRTLEGPFSFAECAGHDGAEMLCDLMGRCPAMDVVQRVHAKIEDVLDQVTCADLAEAHLGATGAIAPQVAAAQSE